jgi:hypothetical protein
MRIFGQHDEPTIQQLERCAAAENGAPAVLCADGHLGYSMPIGGVVGYRDHISPSGVGYDIACGNLAVRTNLRASDLTTSDAYDRIADQISRRVSFGMGRKNATPVREHAVFDAIAASPVAGQRKLRTSEACRIAGAPKAPCCAAAARTSPRRCIDGSTTCCGLTQARLKSSTFCVRGSSSWPVRTNSIHIRIDRSRNSQPLVVSPSTHRSW